MDTQRKQHPGVATCKTNAMPTSGRTARQGELAARGWWWAGETRVKSALTRKESAVYSGTWNNRINININQMDIWDSEWESQNKWWEGSEVREVLRSSVGLNRVLKNGALMQNLVFYSVIQGRHRTRISSFLWCPFLFHLHSCLKVFARAQKQGKSS